ncbi:hypothetical protein FACS189438_3080 [Bacteroidia bacterium]|nr:hypothetical protein FACS189438_3080 [Bacteroidia bacterium]
MPRKLFKYSIVLLALTLLASCSKVPRSILPEKKMKDVMIDMQLAEQLINESYQTYPDSARKAALFESVFRKHNITQAMYDSSLTWYGKHLDIMLQVLDLALDGINTRINDLGDIQAAASNATGDSANIWPRRNYLRLSPGAVFNGTVFNLKPETPYISGSSFVLGMQVWGLAARMEHWPEVKIAAEMQDTTITIKQTIQTDGYHAITLKTLPTKPIHRVYGYIWMNNTGSGYYNIYIDSLKLAKYNYGSDLPE